LSKLYIYISTTNIFNTRYPELTTDVIDIIPCTSRVRFRGRFAFAFGSEVGSPTASQQVANVGQVAFMRVATWGSGEVGSGKWGTGCRHINLFCHLWMRQPVGSIWPAQCNFGPLAVETVIGIGFWFWASRQGAVGGGWWML